VQRRTAVTAAATISLLLLSASTAMAVNTGLLRTRGTGNVGQLSAVAAEPGTPAPTTVPPTVRTIIVTVPPSAVADGPLATTQSGSSLPTTPAPATPTSTTVRRTGDDNRHDERTTTSRPPGAEDDD
jgi:hypothetical protein